MSFPTHPIHIVFFKNMSDTHLDNLIYKHCEEFNPTVRHMCISLAKLLRDNDATYTTNQYGITSARATLSNPEITIDCIMYTGPTHPLGDDPASVKPLYM